MGELKTISEVSTEYTNCSQLNLKHCMKTKTLFYVNVWYVHQNETFNYYHIILCCTFERRFALVHGFECTLSDDSRKKIQYVVFCQTIKIHYEYDVIIHNCLKVYVAYF